MEKLRKTAKTVTVTDYNRLVDYINQRETRTVGGLRVSNESGGVTISQRPKIPKKLGVLKPIGQRNTGVQRAGAQEAGQADGEISVRLLNSAGEDVGAAFDVFAFMDKSANDMGDYLPAIAEDDIIFITKLNDGEWYIVRPTLIEFTECSA